MLAHITATLYYKTSKSCGNDVILTTTTSALVSRIPSCVPKVVTITEVGEKRTVSHCIPSYSMCANKSRVKQNNCPIMLGLVKPQSGDERLHIIISLIILSLPRQRHATCYSPTCMPFILSRGQDL